MDRITLRGIEVVAHHGVHADERLRGQRFVVHATVEIDLAAAAATDDLSATVDYSLLADEIARTATGGPHRLLETVAGSVADTILAHQPVAAAEVTVEKPDAQLPVRGALVSVTVRRERGGAPDAEGRH